MRVDLHVAHRQGHVPPLVRDEEIGGGGRAGNLEGLGDVDAQLSAGGGELLGVQIVAKGGEQAHIHPQKRHIVGDVAPYAP